MVIKKRVLMIYKGDPSEIPLLFSVLKILRNLDFKVDLLCGYCNSATRSHLFKSGVIVTSLYKESIPSIKNQLEKALFWIRFRNFVRYSIQTVAKTKDTVIWLGSGDTALALYGLKFAYPVILHLHELYDKNYLYRGLLRRISGAASAVVCPEPNRAAILRVWFGLKEQPFVLPNKPYGNSEETLSIETQTLLLSVRKLVAGRKIILYQGHIGEERLFLGLARAADSIRENWALVVMGKNYGFALDLLRAYCPNLIYVPYIQPPAHLMITRMARIGILWYFPNSLNNIFCAPNKVWEYAKYGVPFISNKLPAIQNLLCGYKCGICVDDKTEDILLALDKLERHYEDYSQASRQLYESINMIKIVASIIHNC